MRQIDYRTFTHNLDKIAKARHIPIRAMFELTYRCNFNCVHCYIPPRQRTENNELDTKQVFGILDELCDLGCWTLGFTGGEIFLRQDMLEILLYVKKKGFNIVILTNGSLIDKKIADKLKQVSLNKVDITLHSMKQDTFEKITRCPGSHKKVMIAIELLRQRGIPLGIKNCAMRENKGDLEGVAKFADEVGAVARIGAGIVPRLDGDKAPCGHSTEKICNFQKKPETSVTMCGGSANTFGGRAQKPEKKTAIERQCRRRVFKCGAGIKSLTINPQGKLKLCLEIDYPKIDILKTGLKKAWQSLNKIAEDAEKDANFKCNSCDLLEFCSWCPARGWLEDGRLTTCDKMSRQQALRRKARCGILGDLQNHAHHTI
jgi:radical SAM protein with 4Fe4S-binding SPASM domain